MMSQIKNAETLYLRYAETAHIDNDEIWEKYQALRSSIAHLSQQEQITILERAAALATAQERAAFFAALETEE